MMQWFRSVHGAPTHRKWLAVARRCGQPVPVVVAVVWALMDYASRNDDRGSIAGFDCDDLDAYLAVDDGVTESVIAALQDKEWLENGRIASWEEHQTKRDDVSTKRVKAWRERKATERNADVTQCNAPDTDTDTDTEKNPPKPPEGAFEQFWSVYPRRVGKKAALAAYRVALKGTDHETIERGAARYAAWCESERTEPQFIAHPTTWLRAGRWADELKPSRPGGQERGRTGSSGDALSAAFADVGREVQRRSRDSGLDGQWVTDGFAGSGAFADGDDAPAGPGASGAGNGRTDRFDSATKGWAGPENDGGSVPEAAGDIPGRRGDLGAERVAQPLEMVSDVGGTFRPAEHPDGEPTVAFECHPGSADLTEIPDWLKRA